MFRISRRRRCAPATASSPRIPESARCPGRGGPRHRKPRRRQNPRHAPAISCRIGVAGHGPMAPCAGAGHRSRPEILRKSVRGKEIRSMSLTINIRETADATILDMSGRLSLGEALAELRDSIREALASDQKNILLNLAEVSHIDSSGLGQLIGSYATVTERGGQLKLLNLQKRVNDLMQVTKLLTVFETYTNEEAALRSFGKKK